MKKEELINIIVEETGLNRIEASDFVENLFSIIKTGFKKGKRLNIPEFGKFILVSKKGEDGKSIKSIAFSPVKKFSFDANSEFNNLNPIPVALIRKDKDDKTGYYDFELEDDEEIIEDSLTEEGEDILDVNLKQTPAEEIAERITEDIKSDEKIEDKDKDSFDKLIEHKRKSFFDSERYLKGKQVDENLEPTISDKIISDSLVDDNTVISSDEILTETEETEVEQTSTETDLIKKLSELDNSFSTLQSQIESSVNEEIENKEVSGKDVSEKSEEEIFGGIDISKIHDEINAKLKETFETEKKPEEEVEFNESKIGIPEEEIKLIPEREDKKEEEISSFTDIFENKDKPDEIKSNSDDDIKIPEIDFQKIFTENSSDLSSEEIIKDAQDTFEGSDILIPDDIKQLHKEIETESPEKDKTLIPEDDDFNFIKNYSDIFENKSDDELNENTRHREEISDLPPVYTRPPEEEKESNKIFSLSVLLVIAITILVFATTYFLLTSDIFTPKRLPVITDTTLVNTPIQVPTDTLTNINQTSDTTKIKIVGGDTFLLTETPVQKNETPTDTITKQESNTQTNTPPPVTNQEPQYRTLNAGEEEQINDPANGVVYVRTTDGVYIQTGSFKTKTDAEKKVSSLNKSGLNIEIKEANLGAKGIWYRVRAGKFSSVEEAKANVGKIK